MTRQSIRCLFPNQQTNIPFFISMSTFILKELELLHETPTLHVSTRDHLEKQIIHSLALLNTINMNTHSRELFLTANHMDQLTAHFSDDEHWHILCKRYKQLETACRQADFTTTTTQHQSLYFIRQLLEHAENDPSSTCHRHPSNTEHSSSAMTNH